MGLFKPKKPSQYPSTILWFFDQVCCDSLHLESQGADGQTHVTVTASTALVLILTRNPHVAWFSIGALGSSLTGMSHHSLIV
jgi:dolichyldiphosphatase